MRVTPVDVALHSPPKLLQQNTPNPFLEINGILNNGSLPIPYRVER
jgi:hypothetical protein